MKLKHNQFFCCQIYHHWKYHFNRSTLILAFAVSTLQCHASWLNCSCYESRPVKHSSLYLEKDPIIYKIHLKFCLLILSNFCKIWNFQPYQFLKSCLHVDLSCMFMLYCQSPFTFLYNNFSAIYINYISNPLCNGTIVYYIIITCSVSFNILVTIVQTRLNNKIKLPDYIFFFLCHMRSCSVYSMLKFS